MKRKLMAFFLILLFITNGPILVYGYNNFSQEKYINVRLTRPIKNKDSIKLYSPDGFSLYTKDSHLREIEYFDTNYLDINLYNGEIIITDNNNLYYMSDYEDMVIGSANKRSSQIRLEDSFYRGYIFFDTNGRELVAINYISLEEYLYGVVAREMPATFNIEALKAQAIASRTYSLYNIDKHKGEGYNLCDTTHCQVYGGIDGEHENTNRAVDESRGRVIEYNQQIINSVYHANSGGHTRDSKEAWGGDLPYLRGVRDRYSEGVASSTWSYSISPFQLFKNMEDNGIKIGFPLDIEIVERSPADRVEKIKIIGQYGEKTLNEGQYKEVFGAGNFRTTWFSIYREVGNIEKDLYGIGGQFSYAKDININRSYVITEDFGKRLIGRREVNIIGKHGIKSLEGGDILSGSDFILQGKGYGHGVGMSQWGAASMAKQGFDHEEIIKHYYRDVEVNRIY